MDNDKRKKENDKSEISNDKNNDKIDKIEEEEKEERNSGNVLSSPFPTQDTTLLVKKLSKLGLETPKTRSMQFQVYPTPLLQESAHFFTSGIDEISSESSIYSKFGSRLQSRSQTVSESIKIGSENWSNGQFSGVFSQTSSDSGYKWPKKSALLANSDNDNDNNVSNNNNDGDINILINQNRRNDNLTDNLNRNSNRNSNNNSNGKKKRVVKRGRREFDDELETMIAKGEAEYTDTSMCKDVSLFLFFGKMFCHWSAVI